MSTNNFPIETIPARLTTCPLQNNWKEFLCYLSFPANHDSSIERIEWKFFSLYFPLKVASLKRRKWLPADLNLTK